MKTHQMLTLGKIKTSKIEIIDILKSWFIISLSFALVFGGINLLQGNLTKAFSLSFIYLILISLFTVGIGFIIHEFSHKIIAQKYGCVAEFRSFDQMLYFALGLAAFVGFIFAAPGAVMIAGRITISENGKISLAGPLSNFILALGFLGLVFIGNQIATLIGLYGFRINAWLGLFNLIPFWNFDGKKILNWNRYVWLGMLITGIFFIWGLPSLGL